MQMWRTDKWTRGAWGGRESGTNWEIRINIYALPCVKLIVESCYTAQGAQLGAL